MKSDNGELGFQLCRCSSAHSQAGNALHDPAVSGYRNSDKSIEKDFSKSDPASTRGPCSILTVGGRRIRSREALDRFDRGTGPECEYQPSILDETQNNEHLFNIAAFIASSKATAKELRFEDADLRPLWRAGVQPPITVESLSVLDASRLWSYAKLCRDCNFESDILLQPVPSSQAEVYWAVLAFEFALYIQHNSSPSSCSWLLRLTSNSSTAPRLRLQALFEALREILKSLLPKEIAWHVDTIIEPSFLVRQIRTDACDLVRLAMCIHATCKSWWPAQYHIHTRRFVDQLQTATLEKDPCSIANAVRQLLQGLETIKLEISQSYIRRYRFQLVESSVRCEQQYFSSRLRAKSERALVLEWYTKHSGPHKNDGLVSLSSFLVDVVSGRKHDLPTTFDFDAERIEKHRHVFQHICAETAIAATIKYLVQKDGQQLNEGALNAAVTRVLKIDPGLSYWNTSHCHVSHDTPFYAVTLEIARVTSLARRNNFELCADEVYAAETHLWWLMCQHRQYPVSQALCHDVPDALGLFDALHVKLTAAVQSELACIRNLSALDIYRLYVQKPSPYSPGVGVLSARNACETPRSVQDPGEQAAALDQVNVLARGIAHIAVLHWRVWGPLLEGWATERDSKTV